jgi:hypothetical protein
MKAWAKANPEKYKANKKAYNLRHKDRIAEERRARDKDPEYKTAHKESLRAKQNRYLEKRSSWPKIILYSARKNSKTDGMECTISADDIVVPDYCPVFGFPLERGRDAQKKGTSASIDRIDNSKGYIPGNVVIVSLKVNRIKNNATVDEIIQVADFYKKLCA